jgi:hypothetical protein
MADGRAKLVNSLDAQSQLFGVRLDVIENVQLWKASNDKRDLMKFLRAYRTKFLNIGSIFASEKKSSFWTEFFQSKKSLIEQWIVLISTICKTCGQNLQIFATSRAIGLMDMLYIVPYLIKLA